MSVRYGLSFVTSICCLYSPSLTAIQSTLSCHTGQFYNDTPDLEVSRVYLVDALKVTYFNQQSSKSLLLYQRDLKSWDIISNTVTTPKIQTSAVCQTHIDQSTQPPIHWNTRTDSRFPPSQWEAALLCNGVSHWLGTSLESALNTSQHKLVKNHSNDLSFHSHIWNGVYNNLNQLTTKFDFWCLSFSKKLETLLYPLSNSVFMKCNILRCAILHSFITFFITFFYYIKW